MHFWHRVFGRFRRGSKMTKKPVRNQTEPAIPDPSDGLASREREPWKPMPRAVMR